MLTPSAFEDRRSLQTRLAVFRALTIICMSLLAVAFWILQVVQHDKFNTMAENNRLRMIPLPAPRGILFDRHERPLVTNDIAESIQIVRERSRNLNQAIKLLAEITHEDERKFREIIDRHRREPVFRPITLIDNATMAQRAAVLARQLELPEVDLQPAPTRKYPDIGAHLFGYVSEIQESQIDRPEFAGLEAGAIIGQAGVETLTDRSKLESLTHLGLASARLPSAAARVLARWPAVRQLVALDLHGNTLGTTGAGVLAGLKNLRELIVTFCPKITEEGVAKLKQKLPNLVTVKR